MWTPTPEEAKKFLQKDFRSQPRQDNEVMRDRSRLTHNTTYTEDELNPLGRAFILVWRKYHKAETEWNRDDCTDAIRALARLAGLL